MLDFRVVDKPNLAAKITLSDGTSFIASLIIQKVKEQFSKDSWSQIRRFSIVKIKCQSLSINSVGDRKILIIKDVFEIIYTGLGEIIGGPIEYSVNERHKKFEINYDLSINFNATDQKQARAKDIMDI